MDWIEQWLGLSPDGGNGSLEMLYLAVIVAIVLIFIFRNQIRATINQWRDDRRR